MRSYEEVMRSYQPRSQEQIQSPHVKMLAVGGACPFPSERKAVQGDQKKRADHGQEKVSKAQFVMIRKRLSFYLLHGNFRLFPPLLRRYFNGCPEDRNSWAVKVNRLYFPTSQTAS